MGSGFEPQAPYSSDLLLCISDVIGPDYYERQASVRRQIAQIAHHVGKLGALGFEVTLCRLPEPDGSATTQAA